MGLPNWILENVLAVEDMYLTPKPRLQVIGNTTALVILPKVQEKWALFVERHKVAEQQKPTEIEYYLQRLRPEQLTNIHRWAFASVLKLKPDAFVEIGMAWLRHNTSLWFIFADNQLVEFITFRGLRQIQKRAEHRIDEAFAGMPEAERIHAISKYKQELKIQGGLIKQERQPRDRWRNTKRTF